MLIDDLYLYYDHRLSCAHEQKSHGVRLIGVANKSRPALVMPAAEKEGSGLL